jgi:hypothetical protein
MYSVPIIPQSILNNSEFSKVYNLELNNGMFDPVLKAPNYFTGDNRTVYYTDGHEKQMELFKNNYNTTEDQKTTEDQYKQYVNNQKVLQQPISEQEAEIDMYSNTRLDPRLRNEMVMEAVKSKSNIFNTESQDFVEEVRDSYAYYLGEENLYRPDKIMRNYIQQAGRAMNMNDGINEQSVKSVLIDELLKRAEQEQKEKELRLNEAQIRRERFFPMPKAKTADQKFYEKYNIR